MGNSESKDGGGPSGSTGSQHHHHHHHHQGGKDEAKKDASLKRYASNSSSRSRRGAPPTSISAAEPSISTSTSHAHAEVVAAAAAAASPTRSTHHSRPRSISTAASNVSPQDTAHSQRSHTSAMGNADSKPIVRRPSRASTLPIHAPSPSAKSTPPPPPTQEDAEDAAQPEPHAHPVDVPSAAPASSHDGPTEADAYDFVPTGYSESPYGLPPANYSRPPRLPLPIEEEVHTPGSPIISPQDITTPLESADVEGGAIHRKTSVLSSTTVDDDDIGDDAFADPATANATRIPTRLEWNGAGDKVFVTGTFCNWEKKIKLPRNKDGKPGFSANLYLPPGTHHVNFLVNDRMTTSPALPTTVDWTNFLVNYIEVLAPLSDDQQPPEPTKPMPIPGAALTAGQATATGEPATRPAGDQARVSETEHDLPSTLQEADGAAKSVQKPTEPTASIPIPATLTSKAPATTEPVSVPEKKSAAPKPKVPRPKYTNELPQYLLDLDNYQNPEDERYIRAQRVANNLPPPPSLPMFLNKSILNGTTPHKDDASVLIMPNHTVLNHLATSSIKGGVLATSGTTRYKRKFLTTIMYKPTSEDG